MDKRRIQSLGTKRTGKETFTVSLPYEWAKKMKEPPNNGEVYIKSYGDKIILVPSEPVAANGIEIMLNEDRPEELESEIISAYMRNYQNITIKLPSGSEQSIAKLEELRRKLYGMLPISYLNGQISVTVSTPMIPIRNVMGNAYGFSLSIYGKNEEIMGKDLFEDLSSQREKEQVESWETDVDLHTFLAKRLLNQSLIDPEAAIEMGIDNLQDVLEYSSIVSNIERLSDIQQELYSTLNEFNSELSHKEKKPSDTPFHLSEFPNSKASFLKYYQQSNRMVSDAFEGSSVDDHVRLLNILKGRGKMYRPGYIEDGFKKDLIEKSMESDYRLHLLRIENKIWAITGIATNIAEAWMNMHRYYKNG